MRDGSKPARVIAFMTGRAGIVIIGVVILLLGAAGWLALWGTAWSPGAVLRGKKAEFPLAFTPDGTGFATGGPFGGTLWDTATGRARAFWAQPDGSYSGMAAFSFSPDGLTFAAIDLFGPGSPMAITLGDANDGRVRWRLPIPNEGGYAILFTAAGKQVRAIVGVRNSNSGEVVDVDAASGRELARHSFAPVSRTGGSAFSPDDRRMPGYSFDGEQRPSGSAISSDGRLMALPSGTAVTLWDLETDSERAAPVVSSAGPTVSAVGFSLDGSTLAAGLSDGSIEIWDLPALKRRATFRCHTAGAASVGVQPSPDGRTVASLGSRPRGSDPLLGAIIGGLRSVGRARYAVSAVRREVVVVDIVTGQRREVGTVAASCVPPLLSRDGRSVAVWDGLDTVELFDIPAIGPEGRRR